MTDSAPAIVHEAIVAHILPAKGGMEVVVSDRDADRCGACAAAAFCSSKTGARLFVHTPDPEAYRLGQRVRIAATPRMHHRAVALMLGLPCLVLVVLIFGLTAAGLSEGIAALSGIAGAALVYLILYLCRSRLNKELTFNLLDNEE